MNNKGFTLVELLATIIILGVVVGIAGFSITTIIRNAKEKDLDLLKDNIRAASEVYYQECKYSNVDGVSCNYDNDLKAYKVTLGDLVNYGYLSGNSEENSEIKELINPVDNTKIGSCMISIKYDDTVGKIVVEAKTNPTTGKTCPTGY